MFRYMGRNAAADKTTRKEVVPAIPPLTELASCIERMEFIISRTFLPNKNNHRSNHHSGRGGNTGKTSSPPRIFKAQSTPHSHVHNADNTHKVDFVQFASFKEEEEFIELLRRIAELVVLGEQTAAIPLHSSKTTNSSSSSSRTDDDTDEHHPYETQPQQDKDEDERGTSTMTTPPPPSSSSSSNTVIEEKEQEALVLLEYFFERSTLDFIVGLITGDVFRDIINIPSTHPTKKDSSSSLSSLGSTSTSTATTSISTLECIYLPPIPIAIQAVQTISILLQNVVRATSLYLLLSNNRLGSLIQLSLDLYHVAIVTNYTHNHKKSYSNTATSTITTMTTTTTDYQEQQYAELFELTTHFISLLKSIALRINAETLQFFLVYPYDTNTAYNNNNNKKKITTITSNNVKDNQMEEVEEGDDVDKIKMMTKKKKNRGRNTSTVLSSLPKIEFPLYRKSLSFCSSQYDSFVRITAFNICMNLIRASSQEKVSSSSDIVPIQYPNHPKSNNNNSMTIHVKVPNAGTLCNLPTISLQDRLGIMKYICSPPRVELLVSSIFLNIATICTSLEENIQLLYSVDETIETLDDIWTPKQQQQRKHEHTTTPTLEASSFHQRADCVRTIRNLATDLEDELFLLNDILKIGLLGLNEQIVERILTTMIYPQLLQPLHSWLQYYHENSKQRKPMTSTPSPTRIESSDPENIMLSQATASLFFATILFRSITHKPTNHVIFTALCHPMTPHESKSYIVSRSFFPEEYMSYENESIDSYDFRNDSFVDRPPPIEDDSSTVEPSEQAAVFILSPALFILFQSAMSNTKADMIETKLNPYRHALLTALSLSTKFPLLSKVATYLLDSIFARFSPPVVKNILQIHEGIANDDSLIHDLMSSLYSNLITESVSPIGFATLDFDLTTAHTILCISMVNERTYMVSDRLVCLEYVKAISFLSHLPQFITEKLPSDSVDSSSKDSHLSSSRNGSIIYNLFYGSWNGQFKCVVESLNQSHDLKEGVFICIACDSSNGDFSSVFADESRFKAIHGSNDVYKDSVASVLAIIKVATLRHLIKGRSIAQFNYSDVNSLAQALNDCLRNALSYTNLATGGDLMLPLPHSWTDVIFENPNKTYSQEEAALPAAGTVLSFDGKISFPCVVEISSDFYPLIVDKASCIIADGVRWLSLYLVLFGNYFILAEPSAEGSHENGRIISSCCIRNLQVMEDNPVEIQHASPARRLVFTHTSYSTLNNNSSIPELFTPLNAEPTYMSGNNSSLHFPRGSIDLWFENIKAAQLALNTIHAKIERLCSRMGQDLFEILITQKLDDMPEVFVAETKESSEKHHNNDVK